ncbi:MAG: cobalamin-independent methionine synthase II family protein [Pseudomonadota bacterium]
MPLPTTCIGAYPKPDYVPIKDWFQIGHDSENYNENVLHGWNNSESEEAEKLLDRATREAIADQIACGIDVPTDGEIRRDNYVHYQCRHFSGFDFENLTERVLRNGAYTAHLPTIRGPVKHTGNSVLVRDWKMAEKAAGRPVKITLPGPMTISDTTANEYYDSPQAQAEDLAIALNTEILALVDAGCTHIQVDEPIFARKPDAALQFGVRTLSKCFEGVPETVTTAIHMCCGYPSKLDDDEYPKANPGSYLEIAKAVDGVAGQISIEDAHRHNPAELFSLFEKSALIVGFVKIASSQLETVEQIRIRMLEILDLLPKERVIAAPDCGLGFLGRDLAMSKLKNLCSAAKSV